MIGFINTFLSYLILVIASVIIIIAGLFCGKKLRENKDKKNTNESDDKEN